MRTDSPPRTADRAPFAIATFMGTGVRTASLVFVALGLFSGLCLTRLSAACPFCPPSSPTLAEQVAAADQCCVVTWVGQQQSTNPDELGAAQTQFRITELFRSAATTPLKTNDTISVPFLRQGKPGDLFLLVGRAKSDDDPTLEWSAPIEVTETSKEYVRQAPAPEAPAEKRLRYFLRFLEYSDPKIANDAFSEFARAEYRDVRALRDRLPREKIRAWLKSERTEKIRLGFYGLLLGLCGDAGDAEWLGAQVLPPLKAEEFRWGEDGMMAGYVLLTGDAGLQKLVETKLIPLETPDGEILAVLNTLRFFWEYGEQQPQQREAIRAAGRLMLDRPQIAQIVVADLARWKDWTLFDRLVESYDREPFTTDSGKLALIQYVLAFQRDQQASAASAERIQAFLDQVEPDLLRDARRLAPRR